MSVRTKLRDDFDAGAVRRLAKASKDAAQTRRLMALAAIYEGGSHLDAARIGGVTPQIVRDWVVRFNGRGAEGLIAGHAGGSASKLTDDHRRTLAKMIDDGPDPAVDGVVRWRLKDLAAWLDKQHGVMALKPRLRQLRRYPRHLLRSLEQARRLARDDHVHRTASLGTPVMISAGWY